MYYLYFYSTCVHRYSMCNAEIPPAWCSNSSQTPGTDTLKTCVTPTSAYEALIASVFVHSIIIIIICGCLDLEGSSVR